MVSAKQMVSLERKLLVHMHMKHILVDSAVCPLCSGVSAIVCLAQFFIFSSKKVIKSYFYM